MRNLGSAAELFVKTSVPFMCLRSSDYGLLVHTSGLQHITQQKKEKQGVPIQVLFAIPIKSDITYGFQPLVSEHAASANILKTWHQTPNSTSNSLNIFTHLHQQ